MTDSAHARAKQMALYQSRLNAFVVRARRVEAHSLAQDKKQLLEWMRGARKITYEVSPGQPPRTSVVQTTPPEEQLESAAARVRPFILSEEPVYHASVLKAIKALVPQPVAADVAQYLQACKDDWRPYDSKSRDIRGYLMQIEDNDSGEVIELSDKVLGFAWIYGDTIHADEARLKETDAFGLEHRFLAAVPIVTGIMATTILTLNLVRALIQAKMLSVPEELLELPVVEHRTEFTYEGAIYSAEVGTAIPESLTDEPGPEWKVYEPFRFPEPPPE
jgi:hypothetical protein